MESSINSSFWTKDEFEENLFDTYDITKGKRKPVRANYTDVYEEQIRLNPNYREHSKSKEAVVFQSAPHPYLGLIGVFLGIIAGGYLWGALMNVKLVPLVGILPVLLAVKGYQIIAKKRVSLTFFMMIIMISALAIYGSELISYGIQLNRNIGTLNYSLFECCGMAFHIYKSSENVWNVLMKFVPAYFFMFISIVICLKKDWVEK